MDVNSKIRNGIVLAKIIKINTKIKLDLKQFNLIQIAIKLNKNILGCNCFKYRLTGI